MSYLNKIIEETLNLFNEAIQYNYEIPEDSKQQLFDFYIWSFAYQNINTADFFILGDSSAYDLYNIIYDSINKIAPAQKELLLEAGAISIFSELEYPLTGWYELVNYDDKKSDNFISDVKSVTKNYDYLYNHIINVDSYGDIFSLVKKNNNLSIEELIKDAKKIFELGTPNSKYGGPAWVKICQAWLELYNSKSLSSMIKEIDDMYDMQHNTGFALNKDFRFQGNWVKHALDLKFSGNLWNLQKNSSIPQRIVGFISKITHQPTLQDVSSGFIDDKKFIEDITNYVLEISNGKAKIRFKKSNLSAIKFTTDDGGRIMFQFKYEHSVSVKEIEFAYSVYTNTVKTGGSQNYKSNMKGFESAKKKIQEIINKYN